MDRLPTEVLREILSYLTVSDTWENRNALAQLRCTCKLLAAMAAPSLFSIVPLWMSLESLHNLTHLSEHSQISKYVKTIHFAPRWLSDIPDEAAWRETARKRIYVDACHINDADIQLGKYLSAHDSFARSRKFLIEDNMALHLLVRALKNLPNVQNITIKHASRWIGAKQIVRSLGRNGSYDFQFQAENTVQTLLRAARSASVNLKAFKISYPEALASQDWATEYDESQEDRPYEGLESYDEDPPCTSAYGTSLEALLFWGPSKETLQSLEIAELVSARAFPISFDFWSYFSDIIMRNACTLKSIKLDGVLCGRDSSVLLRSLEREHLPLLQRLSIGRFFIPELELLKAIIAPTQRLQEVYLYRINFGEGRCWPVLLKWLRTVDTKGLRRLMVEDCLDDEEEYEDIAPYINHENNNNPLEQYDSYTTI